MSYCSKPLILSPRAYPRVRPVINHSFSFQTTQPKESRGGQALPSPDDLAAQRRVAPRHRRAWNLWLSSCRRLSCPLPDSHHSRDVLRHRPEHQVCGIGDSAIKTARIVLVIRTFEGPVLRATQNKLSFTMWHAAPKPACRPRCPSPSPETSPEIITDLPTLQALARPLRPPQPPAPPVAIARHDAHLRPCPTPIHPSMLAEGTSWLASHPCACLDKADGL